MAINIDYYRDAYFIFDKPVPYKLKCGATIEIKPVKMTDSMIFLSSCGILDIDKNRSSDIEVIQMSYLKYLYAKLFQVEAFKQQMVNICILCMGFTIPFIRLDDKGKAILVNLEIYDNENGEKDIREIFSITAKEFDEIKKIILYQNIIDYDDSYIDPELKANMAEMDALKARGVEAPNLERKIGIISSHTGITKSQQMEMTLREHTQLFEEVIGEVEYISLKGVATYGGKSDDVRWVYRKSKNKYDEYITSVEKYNKSMGGDGKVNKTTQLGGDYSSQYDKFIGG